jgi:hypothetical protein
MSLIVNGEVDAQAASTVQARAALWGAVASVLEGDSHKPLVVISRWAWTKSFEGEDALVQANAWLDRVGAPG